MKARCERGESGEPHRLHGWVAEGQRWTSDGEELLGSGGARCKSAMDADGASQGWKWEWGRMGVLLGAFYTAGAASRVVREGKWWGPAVDLDWP
jgi:hypothetical protein